MSNTMIDEGKNIQLALHLAKQGGLNDAIKLLRQVLKQNPRNAQAWYLLSQVVEDPGQENYCLEKVLEIDPGNTQATERLIKLKNSSILPDLNKNSVNQPPNDEEKRKIEKKNQIIGWISILVIIILCLGAVSLCSTGNDDPSEQTDEPTETDAFIMCRLFVEDRLKAPGTAKFPYSGDAKIIKSNNRFTVSSYVDSENSYGALLRMDFICVVEYQGNDNWILKDLQTESR